VGQRLNSLATRTVWQLSEKCFRCEASARHGGALAAPCRPAPCGQGPKTSDEGKCFWSRPPLRERRARSCPTHRGEHERATATGLNLAQVAGFPAPGAKVFSLTLAAVAVLARVWSGRPLRRQDARTPCKAGSAIPSDSEESGPWRFSGRGSHGAVTGSRGVLGAF